MVKKNQFFFENNTMCRKLYYKYKIFDYVKLLDLTIVNHNNRITHN